MQALYVLALVRQNFKKYTQKEKHAVQIIFNLDKETHSKPLFQE